MIQEIYKNLKSGYRSVCSDYPADKSNDYIYGEITFNGVKTLYNSIDFNNKHFIDIGSGVGKMVIQIALETTASSSTGYEIIKERYNVSCQAKERYDLMKHDTNVEFILNTYKDSLFDKDKLSKYDIYFINNLTWTPETSKLLLDALKRNVKPGNIIISSKVIPIDEITTHSYLEVEMSWTAKYNLHVYKA